MASDVILERLKKGGTYLKAQTLVREWLGLYADRLQAMWDSQTIEKLPPLE